MKVNELFEVNVVDVDATLAGFKARAAVLVMSSRKERLTMSRFTTNITRRFILKSVMCL